MYLLGHLIGQTVSLHDKEAALGGRAQGVHEESDAGTGTGARLHLVVERQLAEA